MVAKVTSSQRIIVLVAVALMASVALVAACSTPIDRSPAGGDSAGAITPGVFDIGEGKSRVIGVLVHRELEGGFWVIANTDTPVDAVAAENLAVLIPSQDGGGTEIRFADYEGRLVQADGVLSVGPDIYMAGPLFEVAQIAKVDAAE